MTPTWSQDGKITATGMAELKEADALRRLHRPSKWTPRPTKPNVLLTVDAVVNYVQAKLNG